MPENKQSAKTKSSQKSPAQTSQLAKFRPNKGIVVALLVIAAVGVIAGLIYFFTVRQSPNNVVMNAIVKVAQADKLQAKGNIETTLERFNGKLNIEFNSAKADQDSRLDAKITYQSDKVKKPVKTDGQIILGSDGTAYLKMNNVKGVVSAAYTEIDSVYDQVQIKGAKTRSFMPNKLIINASEFLNDKWIKLPPSQNNDEANINPFACIQGVVAKYNANSSERRAIVKAYKDNDFIMVQTNADLKAKDDSKGYRVSIDKDKFNSFGRAVQKTSVGKLLTECAANSNQANDQNEFLEGHIDLWINKYSNQITHLNWDNYNQTKLIVDLSYDKGAEVSIPAEAKTITDIFSKSNLEAEAKKK